MGYAEASSKTVSLLGTEAAERLRRSHVAVFGLGGVGGALCEALARAGIGEITVVDGDRTEESNLNRQILALHSNLGRPKAEIAKDRILDINPLCKVHAENKFYGGRDDNMAFSAFDYAADATDDVPAKVLIAQRAKESGVPLISSMGAANRLNPSAFVVCDIFETDTCPLARAMRRALRAAGIEKLRVVYSTEKPKGNGVFPTVPNAAGLLMATEIILHLAKGSDGS